jgi:anti-sigma factor RsiW
MTVDTQSLSCQELVELVTDYLEGALDTALQQRFEQHIGNCDGCNEYLEQLRQTILIAGTLSAEDLPPDAERTLMHAFRDWHSAS